MRRGLITTAVVLVWGGLTIALAQPGTPPSRPQATQVVASPEPACDGVETDQGKLHARVARLHEVEFLQLEHDASEHRCQVGSRIWKRRTRELSDRSMRPRSPHIT